MAESGKRLLDLKTDTTLLDPKFDSYKLCLDRLDVRSFDLAVPAVEVTPSSEQYSVQHAKIFGLANYMFPDISQSKDGNHSFYLMLSNYTILHVTYSEQTKSFSSTLVCSLEAPQPSTQAVPPVIVPVDAYHLFVSNGVDCVYLFMRNDSGSWEKIFEHKSECGVMILEARRNSDDFNVLLHAVVDHKKTDDSDKGLYDNRIYWLTLHIEKENGLVALDGVREVVQCGHMETATFDAKCENLVIIASSEPRFVGEGNDDDVPMEVTPNSSSDGAPEMTYEWSETDEDVTVTIKLDEVVTKKDVAFVNAANSLVLTVKDKVILSGDLGGVQKPEEATYTIDGFKLEITLFKSTSGETWPVFIEGDTRARLIPALTDEQKHSGLHFTSEKLASGAAGEAETFNSAQLEDCDMADEDMMTIYWLSAASGKIERQCDITGHQFLFVSRAYAGDAARICLRRDVDGLLFTVDGHDEPQHVATFNAFGYVQASKTQRKWCGCAPNCSYATIVECRNHAFIYWQATNVNSELRNRKTSEQISEVSKQQVLSLKREQTGFEENRKDDAIIGCHAANTALFLLTHDAVYVANLK